MSPQKKRPSRPFILCAFLFVSLIPLVGSAKNNILNNDRPITLEADKADLNQATGHSTFHGRVKVAQGHTHLHANSADIYSDNNNKLIKAVAHGNATNRAHFWTLNERDNAEVHAHAKQITYTPNTHMVILEGNATVKQGNDLYSAPTITYNMQTQHVTSSGNSAGRTVIVIHPDATQQASNTHTGASKIKRKTS